MPDPWDSSLAEYADRLSRQGGRGAPLAPASRTAYIGDVRAVAGWLRAAGVAGPTTITPSALTGALRGLGWSRATRARALTALCEWLAPAFPPNRSPADLIDRPRPSPPPIPRLSQADAASVVDNAGRGRTGPWGEALDLRDVALLELLYASGLRRQEACDLILAGLDFEHETVRVIGKGAKPRTVPLTEPATRALIAWLEGGRPRLVAHLAASADAGTVFVSRSGRPLDGSAVYRIVARALRGAGRAGGPHLLRHALGTHLLEGPRPGEGAHLRVVQEVLGHSSLATTQRYAGVTTRALQDALRRGHPRG